MCKAEDIEMGCEVPDKLAGYRKKMIEFMKKFDKLYIQHIKVAHPTIQNIHN